MSIESWWPLLRQESREWLIANNGDVVSSTVLSDIVRVSGPVPAEAWWAGEIGPDGGLHLSDAAVDWVEEVANGEAPESPPDR